MDDDDNPRGLRDGHKNKVYAAEAMTFSWAPDLADERAVQAYTDKVIRSAKFKTLWVEYHGPRSTPPSKVIVKFTRGNGARVYQGRVTRDRFGKWHPYIEIGNRGKSTHAVLHELSHLIAWEDHHGRDFARVLLSMVRRFRPEKAATLLAQYKQRRIRYTKPAVAKPKPPAPLSQKAASMPATDTALPRPITVHLPHGREFTITNLTEHELGVLAANLLSALGGFSFEIKWPDEHGDMKALEEARAHLRARMDEGAALHASGYGHDAGVQHLLREAYKAGWRAAPKGVRYPGAV